MRLLEIIRQTNRKIKYYQAGTSELYGGIYKKKQNEKTPFHPRSPYAIAKLYSHWLTKITEMLTVYLLVMEYCLIMKVH